MLRLKTNLATATLTAWLLASASIPAVAADSCVTSACHQSVVAAKNLHEPVKDGDCSSCHKRKAKEHPLQGAKSFEPTAKGAALCNQCHDPKGKKKVVHAPVKDGDCTSCHRPHGASGRFLLDVGGDQTGLCIGCHDSAPFKQKFMHGPAAVGECTKCHDPHEASGKALLDKPVRDVCMKCHADFAKTLKESPFGHPPVKEGPCTACHDPHGAQVTSILKQKMPDLCISCHGSISKKLTDVKVPHKPLLQKGSCANCHSAHYSKGKGLLSSDQKSVCLGCHGTDNLGQPPLSNIKKQLAGKKYLHGPINKGECTACHDPHGSDYFRMLRGEYPSDLYLPYRDGAYGACLKCHDRYLLSFADTTSHTRFRNGSRNLHVVHVANKQKGRTCRVCHEPHASNGEKLLNREGSQFGNWKIPLNFKITPTGGSCTPGCHRSFTYDRIKPEVY